MDLLELRKLLSSKISFITGILMVLFLGFTDYISGYEMSFSIFYLIPISFVIFFSSFRYGAVMSVIAAGTWLAADQLSGNKYSNVFIPYWNAMMRLGYFLLHSFIISKLLDEIKKIKEISTRDSLTGLPNWRFFEEYTSKELQKAKRTKLPFTLCYIDLDNFKQINDTLGHNAGNDLLQIISEIINKNIRPGDIAARIGGDEFVVFLAEVDYEKSHNVLLRIKDNVITTMKSNNWLVTLSMGAITYHLALSQIDVMVKQVDELMYSVKKEGKNNLLHKEHQYKP